MDLKYIYLVVLFLTGDIIKSIFGSIVVNIAILLPYGTEYQFTMMIARSLIDLTVWRLQRRGLFTKDKVKLNYADSKCSSAHAPIEAFKFHNRSINAYLALCVTSPCHPGQYYHIHIKFIYVDLQLEHCLILPEFTTLTRVGLTFNSMAQCMDDIFRVNEWDKILVMYEIQGYQNVGDKICTWLPRP
ncbi:hypothetical protein Btru_068957 [Bulinus truncatus]|nr:hypothetical protein Btru_068957 [Bulinus truncatus]